MLTVVFGRKYYEMDLLSLKMAWHPTKHDISPYVDFYSWLECWEIDFSSLKVACTPYI